jgi:hypothetical protein
VLEIKILFTLLENNGEMSRLVFGLQNILCIWFGLVFGLENMSYIWFGFVKIVGDCSNIFSTSLSRFKISWI